MGSHEPIWAATLIVANYRRGVRWRDDRRGGEIAVLLASRAISALIHASLHLDVLCIQGYLKRQDTPTTLYAADYSRGVCSLSSREGRGGRDGARARAPHRTTWAARGGLARPFSPSPAYPSTVIIRYKERGVCRSLGQGVTTTFIDPSRYLSISPPSLSPPPMS